LCHHKRAIGTAVTASSALAAVTVSRAELRVARGTNITCSPGFFLR